MKIVCDSCGAKYQIADDKVSPGKVFKIRCKKCSSVIVVRGDEPEEQDEATRVFDYGGEAVWHVVVDGEQQGPFAPLQLGGLLSDGKIDPDTYVWKDGFDGWKALREVQELAPIVGTLGADAPVESADLFASSEPTDSDTGGGDADLFGSASASPFAGNESKPAASSKGANLFGSAAAAKADDEVVASRPSPRVSASEAMTGQRNENSVLFSLSNLQALATGPAPAAASKPSSSSSSSSSSPMLGGPSPAAPKQSAGFAAGEASGLIDIRALSSAAAAPRAAAPAKSAAVDDLLSIGGGSSALGAGALAAPALAPIAREPEPAPQQGSNKGILIGGGIVLIAAVAAAVFFATRQPEERVVVREVQVGGDTTTPTSPTEPAGTNTNPTAAPTSPTAPNSPTSPTPTTSARDTSMTAATNPRDTSMTAAPVPPTTTMTPTTATATPPATTTMTAATGDINSLVNMALGQPVAMEAAPADPNLPETPSRDAVGSALRSVSAQVRACGAGEHGSAPVTVVFRGSGAVANATVGGQFAGTPVGQCVARAVRAARVPPFRNASFSVTFPYSL